MKRAATILLFLAILITPALAGALGEQPFTATATLDGSPVAPGGTAAVRVTVAIPKDHYIYRDATSLEALQAEGLVPDAAVFPDGVKKFDPWEQADVEIYKYDVILSLPLAVPAETAPGSFPIQVEVGWRGCNPKMCFMPHRQTLDFTVEVAADGSTAPPAVVQPKGAEAAEKPAAGTEGENAEPAAGAAPADSGSGLSGWQQKLAGAMETAAEKSFFLVLLLAFLGGILASFTPCVYPMIPITVAVIGARGTESRARAFTLSLVYVLGIATLYSVLGVFAAASQGLMGGAFNNPWVMLAISGLFIFMALGMFGVYNFALPASMNTKLSQMGGQSYAGVFVIGLIGGIIISPCTGPVVGSILLMIASGTFTMVQGFFVMFVFSLGIGVLFVVIGTFAESLQRLPSAGGWMTHVKNSFGFIMILAAVYFLGATGFLPAGLLAVVMAIAMVMWAVVLGLFVPMENEAGWPAWTLRTVALLLAMLGMLMLNNTLYGSSGGHDTAAHAGDGIAWQHDDLQASLDAAAEAGTPLFLDFTADNCKQCRELERMTFPDPGVIERSRSFASIAVDITELDELETEMARRYSVPGAPRLVFCHPDGAEIEGTAIQGYVPPATLIDAMDRALAATAGK